MASRPTKAKKYPRPERLTFEAKLRLFCTLLFLPTIGLLACILVMAHFSTAAILSILTIAALLLLLAIAAFTDQVVRPLQTLANVVAALREEDYSFRARGAKRDDPFGDLAIEINALADMYQSQRLGALEAAALFRRVIAELDAPVFAFDQGEILRLVNPAAERVFGLIAERDLGRTSKELKLQMLLDEPDEGVIQLDSPPQQPRIISRLPARAPSRWMVRRSSFRQGGVPHTLLLLSDVSAALREEERIAWRRLIRVLGHEISNSLAPIKSIAGTLRSRLPQTNGMMPDFDRGLGVIESRAESLNRFVQAYRQLAQLPAPAMRRVAVRQLLERVVSLETRLEVALRGAPPVEVFADPDQMEQLLINLVRNGVEAACAAREEALAAGVTPEDPSVTIRSSVDADFLSVIIEDNGPALTNPANLFVPFYTTKKTGSGVGLVLARQIAEAHGGTLDLRNRAGTHGCEAELRIPLAQRVEEATEQTAAH
ncbi:MAG: PAS domain S-box protein [Acidobacteriaceae bacterium]|nr:PAS domain S-box protein [Acidobacteriaceae bacterium]